MPRRDVADRLQVAVVGQADADVLHHRLDDEGGDVAAGEHPLEGGGVVVGDDDRVGEHAAGDAGGRRHRCRAVGRPGGGEVGLHRDEQLVVVAVVAALDLDDLLAAGGATGDAHGVHRRLGAGVGEPPQRQAVALGEELGDDGVRLGGRDVERAVVELGLDRGADGRVHVPGEQRAEAHVEVDVPVAVDVDHVRPGRVGDHDRMRVVGLEARRDAEREDLAGPLRRRLRTLGAFRVGGELPLGDGGGSLEEPGIGGHSRRGAGGGHEYHFPR